MKKLFCIFLCLTLVLGVTGCAKADTRTTTASETPAAAEQTTLQAETEVMLTESVTATEQATTEVATGQSIDYQSTKDFEMILLINDVEIPVFWESCTAVDELKLPTVKSLQTEYAQLLSEKKAVYADYQKAREDMRSLQTAKANVDRILGDNSLTAEREFEKDGR